MIDNRTKLRKGAIMPLWLSVANSLIALGSAAFGVLALIRPEALNGPGAPGGLKAPNGSGNNGEALAGRSGSGDVEGVRLYAAMYAGRAIPLGLAVSAAVWIAPNGRAAAPLLGVAVAAQIADVVAAVANRLKGMAFGAAFAALVHAAALATAL